jgi:hypothetical protein
MAGNSEVKLARKVYDKSFRSNWICSPFAVIALDLPTFAP